MSGAKLLMRFAYQAYMKLHGFVGRISVHAASGKTTGTLSKFELTGNTMSYEIAATGLNAVNEQLDGSVTTSPTPERWAISR